MKILNKLASYAFHGLALMGVVVLIISFARPINVRAQQAQAANGVVQYKPMDRDGNGGWWIVEGYVRAVYIANGYNIVVQMNDGSVHMVNISLSLYSINAVPVWVGERVHLEYGGRISGNGDTNYVFKVWQIAPPPQPKALPPAPPVIQRTYIIKDSYVVMDRNGIEHVRRLKK